MSEESTGRHDGSGCFEIRLAGHLAPRWIAWFDVVALTNEDDGTAVLRSSSTDQAGLHGLLRKVRDTGLPLVSVVRVRSAEPAFRPDAPTPPERPTQENTP
jgi:hypothetical protein